MTVRHWPQAALTVTSHALIGRPSVRPLIMPATAIRFLKSNLVS